MCKAMEDFVTEEKLRDNYRKAKKMILMGRYSLEEISDIFELPLETVEKLAQKYAGKPE